MDEIPDRFLLNRSDPNWRALAEDEGFAPLIFGWLRDFCANNNYYNNNNNYNNYYNYNNNNYYNRKLGHDMQPGFKAIAIPFGYTITWIVGWLERTSGDEYVMRNARRIKSLGNDTHETRIANACSESDLSEMTDYEIHRLQILTAVKPGDNWLKFCPKPKDFQD